jgi:hypothetical protein
MPEQIPELITAREFRVIDPNGTIRARLGGSVNVFSLRDESGNIRVGMNNIGIRYWDGSGTNRFGVWATGISYWDANQNVVWSTDCVPNCPGWGRLP